MCRHYESWGPSGPRGEPPDTPGGEDCKLEHNWDNDECEVCLETGIDPPHHGCDESCPDYDPIPEPDWDSMRGGHDDY